MNEIENSINLLEELDNLSQIHILQREDIDEMMIEFAKRIIRTVRIERMSVWLFNQDRTAIVSMGEYDSRDHRFKKNNTLLLSDYPNYFASLEKNKIVLIHNVFSSSITAELESSYSKPNDIISLMDIPLRIGGDLIGVMCFEKTGKQEKKFTTTEQTFALSVSLVFASNLEARHRRAAQHKLNEMLEEKELLIKEINHRVKNNFSILISLLRISKAQGLTNNPKVLLEEYEQRIFSMMKIQDLLIETGNYSELKIASYLSELIKEFRKSHPEQAAFITSNIAASDYTFHSKAALHIGLIVTEIFLNSIKHSLKPNRNYSFDLSFLEGVNKEWILKIKDNGDGFDFEKALQKNTMGLPLIKDLAKGLNFSSLYPSQNSSEYTFIFATAEKG